MIIVIKAFADSKDKFKPYKVGDKKDFGVERNAYLVDKGYAEYEKKEKVLKPKRSKKPVTHKE